jgi:hypothetical protein
VVRTDRLGDWRVRYVAGYLGLKIGWVEGFEINFFGAVLGVDFRRPALKLPGIGCLGVATWL